MSFSHRGSACREQLEVAVDTEVDLMPDDALDAEDVLDSVDDPGEAESLVDEFHLPSFGRLVAPVTALLLFLLLAVAGLNALSPPVPRPPPEHVCWPQVAADSSGHNGCSRGRPCAIGGSDCDSDAACQPTLACFKRDRGEPVPGVNVSAIPEEYDVCYDPVCDDTNRSQYAAARWEQEESTRSRDRI